MLQLRRDLSSLFRLTGWMAAGAVIACLLATPGFAGAMDWATGPSINDEEGKRDWRVEVKPYLWLASLNGTMALPRTPGIPVGATFSDLASNLDAAFAGVLNARWRRWSLISDNSWVSLRVAEALPAGPISGVDVRPEIAFGTVAAAYELPLDQPVSVEVYLGARWWYVTASAAIFPAAGPVPVIPVKFTEAWADAVVGTRIRYAITEKWKVGLTGDIGAGNSNLDWQVLGGLEYWFNDHVGLTAAYRILGVDYEKKGLLVNNGGFKYDIRQSGLLLGFDFAY